ncbi:hypothetical protein PG989_012886 [Apiospora arundinis]
MSSSRLSRLGLVMARFRISSQRNHERRDAQADTRHGQGTGAEARDGYGRSTTGTTGPGSRSGSRGTTSTGTSTWLSS